MLCEKIVQMGSICGFGRPVNQLYRRVMSTKSGLETPFVVGAAVDPPLPETRRTWFVVETRASG